MRLGGCPGIVLAAMETVTCLRGELADRYSLQLTEESLSEIYQLFQVPMEVRFLPS